MYSILLNLYKFLLRTRRPMLLCSKSTQNSLKCVIVYYLRLKPISKTKESQHGSKLKKLENIIECVNNYINKSKYVRLKNLMEKKVRKYRLIF